MMKIDCLDRNAVAGAIDMPAAIAALKMAFIGYARGSAKNHPRSIFDTGEDVSSLKLLTMSGSIATPPTLTTKVATVTPNNGKHNGLPLLHAMVVLVDGQTGQFKCLMEGTTFSAIKTGAMAGLVTDLLADKNAGELAVIGCGEQAKTQILAICSIRSINKISLHSRTDTSALALKQWIDINLAQPPQVKVYASAAEAVATADIISTCTSKVDSRPLFEATDIKPGVHINAIGGASLEAIEVAPQMLANARVFVEDLSAALRESNELKSAIKASHLVEQDIFTIGELLTTDISPPLQDKATTYFCSVGIALQDAAIAGQIYHSAKALDLCQSIQM
ncbi:MAG: ornithine cyclodeaminase family protein [Algicola sp.]|nr:ornithine cyclodeaminase family protein [Algicola sp.]